MRGERAGGQALGRLSRLLIGDKPAAVEVLLGADGWQSSIGPVAAMWMVVGGLGGAVPALIVRDRIEGFGATVVGLVAGAVVVAGLATLPFARVLPRNWFYLPGFASPVIAAVVMGASGAHFGESAVFVPAFCVVSFGFATRRAGVILCTLTLVAYGVMLATVEGFAFPVARFVGVASFATASSVLLHWAVSRLEAIAESERRAAAEVDRLAQQLAVANARLQRYVAPQVAAVVAEDTQALLQPHRADISVLFVDLRGFTSFTVAADPGDVVSVLADYYAVIGQLVEGRGATLARFAGDGIMAYFGDPAACDDPGEAAVDLALAFRGPMSLLRVGWDDRGFGLGYGVGIGTGPATLGSVGFEERRDYTALGPVVNLAARLCAEAADGEILIDGPTHASVRHRVETEPFELHLKGLPNPVTSYRVHPPTH